MPRFFTDYIDKTQARIVGDDAVHIGRSLRMRLGDEIILCKAGTEYVCKILTISDTEVVCDIVSAHKTAAEPGISLTLYQAVPKLDKLEFIVQKATELGCTKIVPFLSSRCVSRPDAKSFAKKRERLSKIALEAAKQSGRGICPEVADIISFKQAVSELSQNDVSLTCYEKGGKSLNGICFDNASSVGVMIGSEGGFEQAEADFCVQNGAELIGLGPRILRCETAPVAAVSIIMSLTGNM